MGGRIPCLFTSIVRRAAVGPLLELDPLTASVTVRRRVSRVSESRSRDPESLDFEVFFSGTARIGRRSRRSAKLIVIWWRRDLAR